MDIQVLIVGAGPAGLMLAIELRRRGVECRLIDSLDAPQHWDRATVVHPRSLELFEALGIADRFMAAGVPQRGARLYSDGEVLGALDFSVSGEPYAYNLGLSEEVTERFLTEYLEGIGGAIERSTRLVDLEAGADSVTATLEHDGGAEETVVAEWLVGCDGYHSRVRELAGIELQGHDIDDPWAVFDVSFGGREDDFETTIVYLEETMVILTPLPGRRFRVYTRPHVAEDDFVADATAVLARYLPDQPLEEIENPTRFHCHAKVADRYRAGRILLAGDAAHVCSPDQGHGMNTGLGDAANLGWKLALVCGGVAAAELLDSYEVERRPVALGVAESGDALEAMGRFDGAEGRAARDRDVRAMLTDPESVHHEAVAEAEMNIDYASSPVVSGDGDGALAAGARLPDLGPVQLPGEEPRRLHELAHRPGHTLLLLAGEGREEELAALLAEAQGLVDGSRLFEAAFALSTGSSPAAPVGRLDPAAAAALGVDRVTVLAIRPDRHLGLRGEGADLAGVRGYAELVLGAAG
ncbi:MAG TPA: FAD-dependent monooxygenase [Solirubrobacterales bacterium]|nr:FAD-dependent monooxygenase [Solirubrobacterales bacterium]